MALVDVAPASRGSVGQTPVGALRAIGRWFAEQHVQSVRRAALRDLMAMPSHRLRDLGVDAFAVQQALQRGPSGRG